MKQPVHITRADGRLRGRDAIWQCIRELKTFTLFDIQIRSTDDKQMDNVNGETARTYVTSLENAGYLERQPRPEGVRSRVTWKLIKDIGVNAPRVRKDGQSVSQGEKREQMWRSMRILNNFDANTLLSVIEETIELKIGDVKDYIVHLHKARYLVEVNPAKNKGGLARYRLLPGMNTGPKPPMIQRIKQVFDQNLNKVVWPLQKEDA